MFIHKLYQTTHTHMHTCTHVHACTHTCTHTHAHTLTIATSNGILFELGTPLGDTLLPPLIPQLEFLNLFICQSLHVGRQRDAMLCKLLHLCAHKGKTLSETQHDVATL